MRVNENENVEGRRSNWSKLSLTLQLRCCTINYGDRKVSGKLSCCCCCTRLLLQFSRFRVLRRRRRREDSTTTRLSCSVAAQSPFAKVSPLHATAAARLQHLGALVGGASLNNYSLVDTVSFSLY